MSGISTLNQLTAEIDRWKSNGEKVVFTNGVFDILHIGHVHYLEEAKKLGDRLVVGVNADESVRRLNKGPERPINPEQARAGIIAALRCVDAAIIFSDDTPYDLICRLSPDVLVKGGDYDPEEKDPASRLYIVGSKEVIAAGGKVIAIPLVQGFSTTGIVKKMRG